MKIIKRLFFGFEAHIFSDQDLPPRHFHQTVAFLGACDYEKLKKTLTLIPKPAWKIGFCAIADGLLFLPPKHPTCVALSWQSPDHQDIFLAYQKELSSFLFKENFLKKEEALRPFLPHVTLCRRPFKKEWSFHQALLTFGSLHLYESLGHSNYKEVWTYPLKTPFEEISHTADIAFIVRGRTLDQLAKHAFFALASNAMGLLANIAIHKSYASLDDIIASLNHEIALLDIREGSPLKAVSYHGRIKQIDDILEWEMIVDV